MRCYIFQFKTEKDAKFIFDTYSTVTNKKMFRFCKDDKHYVAIYCRGIGSATLSTLVSNGIENLRMEIIPDFGYFCELEKVQIIEMCNV